jgi:hypothetical protein
MQQAFIGTTEKTMVRATLAAGQLQDLLVALSGSNSTFGSHLHHSRESAPACGIAIHTFVPRRSQYSWGVERRSGR